LKDIVKDLSDEDKAKLLPHKSDKTVFDSKAHVLRASQSGEVSKKMVMSKRSTTHLLN
jgi:hypothetical protein